MHNRSNWLFANISNGASLYGLVQSARAEPYAYLLRLFAELPAAHTVARIDALLPLNVRPQD